jgi:hypothetical protein
VQKVLLDDLQAHMAGLLDLVGVGRELLLRRQQVRHLTGKREKDE